MKDRSMICIQCGNQFVLTSNEQERLFARGFNFPKRCPDCRKRKSNSARDAHDDWDNKRRRKQSRKEINFFDDEI